MSKFKQSISLDNQFRPDKGYRHSGAEGYSFQNGEFVFSDKIDVWMTSKARRGKKRSPNLF